MSDETLIAALLVCLGGIGLGVSLYALWYLIDIWLDRIGDR